MRSEAKTVDAYLAEQTPGRRAIMEPVLELVRQNLPAGYQEVMNWGMISWEVPLSTYPDTYNGQPLAFAGLASQKNKVSLYLMGIYSDPEMLALLESGGKKLDMGKSCIRYSKVEQLPLPEIAKIVRSIPVEKFIALFERQYPRKDKK